MATRYRHTEAKEDYVTTEAEIAGVSLGAKESRGLLEARGVRLLPYRFQQACGPPDTLI